MIKKTSDTRPRKDDKAIKWSIIIPHYNQPHLLERLLFTIPVRNDLEVIVVDDCSDAEFLESLRIIREKYPQYHFTTTEVKGGGGLARNIGIEKAKGDYIIFADSDDFFLPSFNTILDKYVATSIDIIFFNIISLDSETGEFNNQWKRIDWYFKSYYNKKNNLPLKYLFGEPWGKIIKKDLILGNDIRFDTVPIHNDTTFSYLVGHYAKTMIVEDVRAYCWTYRIGSVSHTISWERLEITLNVFSRKYIFLKENDIPVFDRTLISPFHLCIKERKYDKFRRYMQIVEKYGIPKTLIYSYLLMLIFLSLKQKVKSIFQLTVSA